MPRTRSGRPAWVTRVVLLVVALVATYIVVRLVGRIDRAAVWDAMSQLTWWQPFVLLAVVVVRQVTLAPPRARGGRPITVTLVTPAPAGGHSRRFSGVATAEK